ncbi:hypothetical protein FHL15_003467 [Xylaria flabelliformis]|uniref:Ubiquitin-like domain-containing protein n=1 Tax=Xylaria flabelliformis TaxID=2512241 RepID=A0A553I5M7_9PEZI|nr:hypothetical protein FHL15_003467 [Xylaria flabelliformis]
MSFGYSIGDFIAGANLTCQLVRVLSASRGACIEYQEALTELRAMEQAFLQAGNLVKSRMFTQDVINAIACIALSSIDTIDKFLERTRDLQSRLDNKTYGLNNSWSKVGWQFYGKEELRALKTQLHERLSSINTLITTASNFVELPSAVAQYQDGSMGNPTDYYTHRKTTRSPSVSSATTNSPSPSDETLNLARVAETNIPPLNEISGSKKTVGYYEQEDAQTSLHYNPSIQKSSSTHLAVKVESTIPNEDEFEKAAPRTEKSQAEMEREIRAKIETEQAEAAAAAKDAEAETQFRRNIEMIKQMMTSLHEKEAKREAEAQAQAEKAKEVKAPIRFKDAVGRKFSFPFHECQRWQGMEELIKQAFLHVDVIGPHVQAGHYDLIGPNGEIILPQVWEKVIEPDWHITMHMWPMDRPGPPRKPGPPRPGGPLPPRQPGPPPPPPHKPLNSAQKRPQHLRPVTVEGFQPNNPAAEHPINRPTEQEAKSVSNNEYKQPIKPVQLHGPLKPSLHDAKGELRKASGLELLDRFDPNWRKVYKNIISDHGLTDEFIQTHQAQIIRFLQKERNSMTAQVSKRASSTSAERGSTCSSSSQESDIHKKHPHSRKSRSLRLSAKSQHKRRAITKKIWLERGWETDEE